MLAEPVDKLAVGVKVAVRDNHVPLIALKFPPDTAKSPAVPFQVKLVPGSSENVNVIVAFSPTFSAVTFELIVTVGAIVSIVIEGEVPDPPVLPAESA